MLPTLEAAITSTGRRHCSHHASDAIVRVTQRPELFRNCSNAEKLSPMFCEWQNQFRAGENSESRQADTDRHRLRSKRDTTGISSRADVPDVVEKRTREAVHSAVMSASERQGRHDRCQRSASAIAEASALSEPEWAESQERAYSGRKVHDRSPTAREFPDQRALSCLTDSAATHSPVPSFHWSNDPPASHHSWRRRFARWPVAGSTRRTPPR